MSPGPWSSAVPPPGLHDLDEAVELLERALGHTRSALAGVRPAHLALPTPCARWDLDDLLWHMDDALDAFTEAADGLLDVRRPTPVGPAGPIGPEVVHRPAGVEARLARLQTKACHLLGLWSTPRPGPVTLRGDAGGLPLAAPLLVGTAALEITVHGWDVAATTGEWLPVPEDLAHRLLPVAAATIGPGDRGRRFAPALPASGWAPAEHRLLARLGRPPRAVRAA